MNSPPKRRRRLRAEQEVLVHAWQTSNLSAEVFAAQHDISTKTLYRWRTLASQPRRTGFLRLLPKPASPPDNSRNRRAAAELEREGLVIRLYDNCPTQLCAPLMAALGGGAKC